MAALLPLHSLLKALDLSLVADSYSMDAIRGYTRCDIWQNIFLYERTQKVIAEVEGEQGKRRDPFQDGQKD